MTQALDDLLLTCDRLDKIYSADLLGYPKLWDRVRRQLSAADGRLQEMNLDPAKAPSLETPTPGDGLTVGRHLQLARDKAVRPPRVALVGSFSVGKSTLLNAVLHSTAFNELLRRHLGHEQLLLKVGDEATTGNVTELEFSGARLSGEDAAAGSLADLFSFRTTYLSETELKELVRYSFERMHLNLPLGALDAPNWHEVLKLQLPNLQKRYDQEASADRKNLIVLWEIIESLQKKDLRELLGKTVDLGQGKAGLQRFLELVSRKLVDPRSKWAESRADLYLHEFHFVKFLQVKMPHPDFEDLKFSLFDFPGLGTGLHRDEFISRHSISEANIIMVPFRPGIIGGEAVEHILDTFTHRRAGMPVEEVMKRVYFIHNGAPPNAPRDRTLVEFYKSFLQAVKNMLKPILSRKGVEGEAQKTHLKKYLSHFLGCDARVGGFARSGAKGATTVDAVLREHQGHVQDGYFDCPTDLETLKSLSQDLTLTDPNGGFPVLASMLADPGVGQAVADVFTPMEEQGGIAAFIKTLKRLLKTQAAEIQVGDVREHLTAAVRPLTALIGLPREMARERLDALALGETSEQFEKILRFEERWQKLLEVWQNGQRKRLETEKDLLGWHRALVQAQVKVEEAIHKEVAALVTRTTLEEFCRNLELAPGGSLANWLTRSEKAGASVDPDDDDDPFQKPKQTDANAASVVQKLLKIDHTLVLYRYYLDRRRQLLRFFHERLFDGMMDSVARIYLEAARGVWDDFGKVWQRAVEKARERRDEQDQKLDDFRSGHPVLDKLFSSVAEYTQGPDWPLRTHLTRLLPRDGWKEGRGRFYQTGIRHDLRVRISDWGCRDELPATSKQLAAWLKRMRLLNDSVALPEYTQERILRVLKGIGLLDQQVTDASQVRFANPTEDFHKRPLPGLTEKQVGDDRQEMIWNPVPFDLYAGPYSDEDGLPSRSKEPSCLPRVRDHLAQLFSDLAVRFLHAFREYYFQKWQNQLVGLLKEFRDDRTELWDWLEEKRHELLDVDPITERMMELQEAVASLHQRGWLR